jgi:hypothetical protein
MTGAGDKALQGGGERAQRDGWRKDRRHRPDLQREISLRVHMRASHRHCNGDDRQMVVFTLGEISADGGGREVQKLVSDVLTVWRSAERLAGELPADSPKRSAVLAAAEQLQLTFNELTLASGADDEAIPERSEADAALEATSKDIAADARRLHAIENSKQRAIGNDERLVDLSLKARELSLDIAAKAQVELDLAEGTSG